MPSLYCPVVKQTANIYLLLTGMFNTLPPHNVMAKYHARPCKRIDNVTSYPRKIRQFYGVFYMYFQQLILDGQSKT